MKKQYNGTWESLKQHEVPEWYQDCKLGIFIHWGIYSVPAFAPPSWELGEIPPNEEWYLNNPYAEWYYNSVNVGEGPTYEHHIKTYGQNFSYQDFLSMWRAENWNPEEWANLFKESGAGYVVLTTKHHDGFCLFPSRYTDFHVGNYGPKRDIVGELTDAVRKNGMKMGLYYSGLLDWQFTNEPIFSQEEHFTKACPTFAYADYAYLQSMELIDCYHPSIFWNDLGWPVRGEEQLPFLLAHYYNTVEDGVVNDRFNGLYKDYSTKEYRAGEINRTEKWEQCRGMGLSFGYNQEESEALIIKPKALIKLLVETVANNGNLLLNVGPKADGTIPKIQVECLRELGQWLKVNGEGIYGTRCREKTHMELENGMTIYYTERNDIIYAFLEGCNKGRVTVEIPGRKQTVEALDKNVNVEYQKIEKGVRVTIDVPSDNGYMIGLKLS